MAQFFIMPQQTVCSQTKPLVLWEAGEEENMPMGPHAVLHVLRTNTQNPADALPMKGDMDCRSIKALLPEKRY